MFNMNKKGNGQDFGRERNSLNGDRVGWLEGCYNMPQSAWRGWRKADCLSPSLTHVL